MEATQNFFVSTYKSDPVFIENKTFHLLNEEWGVLKNLKEIFLNKICEKSNPVVVELIKEHKAAFSRYNSVDVNKIGRWIRDNNRFHCRVQDLVEFYDKREKLDFDSQKNFDFIAIIFLILQSYVEKDYFNWLDAKLRNVAPQEYTERALAVEETITHRVHVLVHNYKFKAGLVDSKRRKKWLEEGGQNRYDATFTFIKSHRRYQPTKQSELIKAIELLQEFPVAQKAAIEDLKDLKNS